jgi:hypothetical protein
MGSRVVYRLIIIAVVLLVPHTAAGYVLGPPPAGRMLMTIDVDPLPYPYIGGTTTADFIVAAALLDWNSVGVGWRPDFNFFSYRFAPVAQSCARDGVNAVTTRYTKCGFFWGDTIAVTISSFDGNGRRVEADIIGNANLWWDYYDGPARYLFGVVLYDIYRVAAHEAGHIIGLDHEWTGSAIMAERYNDVDSIQADDVAGAHAVAFPPPPAASTLVKPSGSIATAWPTYVWYAVADSTHYYLWVDDSTTNKKIGRWYTAAEAQCPTGMGWCSATAETGATGDSRWWIQTWNPAGYGPWAGPLAFRAPAPPGHAELVSPSGTVNTVTPTYRWTAVPEATWYRLWVGDGGDPARITQWYRAADAGCGSGSCVVIPTTSLAAGPARWWIQGWNDAGYGPWSSGLSFTVVPPPPPGHATLASPSGTIVGLSPTYTWNAVPGATWYYLWVNDTMGNRIMQWYRAADAGCPDGVGTCSVTPSTALAPGPAQWWIQTWSPNGHGPWSLAMTFVATTPPPPGRATLFSPTGAIVARTPTYTWISVPGATWYYLWVNDSSGTRIAQWYPAADAGCAGNTPNCSITPPTILASGAAQWWIQAWNPSGYGPWSTALEFAIR